MDFADELAAFRARTADPGFDGLILLGTRQATTAALLLGTLQLERVAFLLTEDTRTMPLDVARLLERTTDGWLCREGDHSTTLRVYEGLRGVLEAWRDLECSTIAVDVTGGLKPMSLGLEKAAHVLGLTTIYIQSDYERLPDGRFVVKPGSQRLEIPPDPYTIFGDLEAAEARRLYAAHDYAGARRIFAQLAARVPPPDDARYAALAELAAMYAAWDVLDFTTAVTHASALCDHDPACLPLLANQRTMLMEQGAMLRRLASVAAAVVRRDDEATRTLADPQAVLPLVGTLHAAALRRADQGRYDFAALFRYRCLELISQHRLATYGLLTNHTNYSSLPMPRAQLSAAFQACQRAIGRKQPKGLPDRITLFDGYLVLAALDDPLVRGYELKCIEDRTRARNQSVLAHGYRLIDQEEYRQFAEVVDEIIDRFFEHVLYQLRQAWEAVYRFVIPF